MIVKLTVEVEGRNPVVFRLDEFQMWQNRDLIPMYDPDDFGRIKTFVENPANPGVKVTINGKKI